MIPAAAIREFLDQPRDDHRWLKDLTHKQVDRLLDDLDPPPKFWYKLGLHQKVGLYLGIKYKCFAFFYDMGCVDGDTEYLSPTGWRKIKEWSGDEVAQYDPMTRTASFVRPTSYIDRACVDMIHFKTVRGLDQMLSAEHRMLVVGGGHKGGKGCPPPSWKHTPVTAAGEYSTKSNPNPWFYNVSAQEMFDIKRQRHVSVATTFLLDGPGVALTDAQIRVQIAVHADGYLANKSKVVIRVKKNRKKQRIRELLRVAAIPYIERDLTEGYSAFRFTPPRHTKVFGQEWWSCSTSQKIVICDEVGHWDGSFRKSGGVGFFSRSACCAEFIQFCFVSTNRRAFLAKGPALEGGKFDYVVHAIGQGRTTNLVNLLGGLAVSAPGGRKYCFEVPTHYLVLRRNGNVFITGNTGKTLTSLELLQYWWDCGLMRRGLVFVTSDKAFPTWERQTVQYKMTMPFVSLDASSSERKWEIYERSGNDGLVFLAYPGAVYMVSEKVNSKGKQKLKLVPELVDRLLDNVDAVVWDESTRCANRDSLTYKLCWQVSREAEFRYALAGMPFGRDPTPLWPQLKLVDHGETLGPTLGLFRETFFNAEANPHSSSVHSKDYTFKAKMKPVLSELVQHRSMTYTAEECIDVPKVNWFVEEVKLPSSTRDYYDKVVADIIDAKGNLKAMKNAFLRMRQLSSGFMGLRDDETGERAEIEFEENPKLERLLDLIEDLPENRKSLVFYEYTYSGRRIFEELKKRNRKAIWLWSGTKNSKGDMARFIDDDVTGTAVINNKVGAYSLDGLQVANYEFHYESALSVIDRTQAEKRIARQGQLRKCFIYDLVVRDTVDMNILDFHRQGKDLFKAILTNPRNFVQV